MISLAAHMPLSAGAQNLTLEHCVCTADGECVGNASLAKTVIFGSKKVYCYVFVDHGIVAP